MGFHHEFVQFILFTECTLLVLLLLPFPATWRKSMLIRVSQFELPYYLKTATYVVFTLILLMYLDALHRSIRSDYMYSMYSEFAGVHSNAGSQTDFHAKRFYAQRNVYLTGFTLFLAFILNSFVKSLIQVAKSEERIEVVRKQAGSQSSEYKRLLSENSEKDTKIEKLQADLAEATKKCRNSEALTKQAEGIRKEYDRLSEEYNKLESRVGSLPPESSKDK